MTSSKQTPEEILIVLNTRGWISLRQFAILPGIDVAYPTAHRMKQNGQIKGTQVGGVYRIYAKEVRRFLEEGNAVEEGDVNSSPSITQPVT